MPGESLNKDVIFLVNEPAPNFVRKKPISETTDARNTQRTSTLRQTYGSTSKCVSYLNC